MRHSETRESRCRPLRVNTELISEELDATSEDTDACEECEVPWSEFMTPAEVTDVLLSLNPDVDDTNVYSSFYTFLLNNMWRFESDVCFETIVRLMFQYASPGSGTCPSKFGQTHSNIVALMHVTDLVSRDRDDLTAGGKQLLERIWGIILVDPLFIGHVVGDDTTMNARGSPVTGHECEAQRSWE